MVKKYKFLSIQDGCNGYDGGCHCVPAAGASCPKPKPFDCTPVYKLAKDTGALNKQKENCRSILKDALYEAYKDNMYTCLEAKKDLFADACPASAVPYDCKPLFKEVEVALVKYSSYISCYGLVKDAIVAKFSADSGDTKCQVRFIGLLGTDIGLFHGSTQCFQLRRKYLVPNTHVRSSLPRFVSLRSSFTCCVRSFAPPLPARAHTHTHTQWTDNVNARCKPLKYDCRPQIEDAKALAAKYKDTSSKCYGDVKDSMYKKYGKKIYDCKWTKVVADGCVPTPVDCNAIIKFAKKASTEYSKEVNCERETKNAIYNEFKNDYDKCDVRF